MELKLKLWEERRVLVANLIKRLNISSIADFGCGEGQFIFYLIKYFAFDNDRKLKYILGVDRDKSEIEKCCQKVKETISDYRLEINNRVAFKIFKKFWIKDYLINLPNLRLFNNDILEKNEIIKQKIIENKVEMVILIEVIEHLQFPEVDKIFEVLLEFYSVKYVLITTPNKEYNVNYGLKDHELRHFDHKFEWNRKQFEEVCLFYSLKYNYKVEFEGVGSVNESHGHPTQTALFTKIELTSEKEMKKFNIKSTIFQTKINDSIANSTSSVVFNLNYLLYKKDKILTLKKFANDLYSAYNKIKKTEGEDSGLISLDKIFNFYHKK